MHSANVARMEEQLGYLEAELAVLKK